MPGVCAQHAAQVVANRFLVGRHLGPLQAVAGQGGIQERGVKPQHNHNRAHHSTAQRAPPTHPPTHTHTHLRDDGAVDVANHVAALPHQPHLQQQQQQHAAAAGILVLRELARSTAAAVQAAAVPKYSSTVVRRYSTADAPPRPGRCRSGRPSSAGRCRGTAGQCRAGRGRPGSRPPQCAAARRRL